VEKPEKTAERKAQELMEETESDSRTRVYSGFMDDAVTVILVGFAGFQLWANLTVSAPSNCVPRTS